MVLHHRLESQPYPRIAQRPILETQLRRRLAVQRRQVLIGQIQKVDVVITSLDLAPPVEIVRNSRYKVERRRHTHCDVGRGDGRRRRTFRAGHIFGFASEELVV